MAQVHTKNRFKSGFLDRTPEEEESLGFPECLDDYSRTLSFIGSITLVKTEDVESFLKSKYTDSPEALDKYLSKRILKEVEDDILRVQRDEILGHVRRLEYLLESLEECKGEKMFAASKVMDRLTGWKKARSILKQELSHACERRDEFLKSKEFKLSRLGE